MGKVEGRNFVGLDEAGRGGLIIFVLGWLGCARILCCWWVVGEGVGWWVVESLGRLEVNGCGDGRIWWELDCVDVINLVIFVGCGCVRDDGGWGGVGKLGER